MLVPLPTAQEFLNYLTQAKEEGKNLEQVMRVYAVDTDEYYEVVDIQIADSSNRVVEEDTLVSFIHLIPFTPEEETNEFYPE